VRVESGHQIETMGIPATTVVRWVSFLIFTSVTEPRRFFTHSTVHGQTVGRKDVLVARIESTAY
jgi:hypothetical protein